MSYRIFDYHVDEFLLFENKLNTLSVKGYNPYSLDLISKIKKDNQQYHYVCDIALFKKGQPKKDEIDRMINSYLENGYDYCGRVRKIYVFRSKEKLAYRYHQETDFIPYFKEQTKSRITGFAISLLFSLAVTYFISTNIQIKNMITNGSIMLYLSYIPICLTILYYTYKNWIVHEKIRRQFLKQQDFTKEKLNQLSMHKKKVKYMIGFCLIYVLAGFSLDYLQRDIHPLDSSILTLNDFSLTPSKDQTYTSSRSILTQGKICTETNQKDIIHSEIYTLKNHQYSQTFFNRLLNEHSHNRQKKAINKNTYLIASSKHYDTVIMLEHNKIIYVTTSLDLTQNNYAHKIIKFYKK